ncbi:hypothetical protein R3W88_018138 [Solanum pinnatisectum]|uniref:FRIGIDA-like protein n=1 Tax=Solanum pinnatisectum TaxID=50273 RepID=A0AAV9L253_9SOLN|nr:hypothetical protein R3W88_018138 [Solanum pinnatisectum]
MLVLKCLDKFYLQGSRAYVQGSHMILQREASVLALECLLLTMVEGERVVEIAEGVKKDAKQAALAWKERLNSEGGVRKAYDMDARGLLLFLGCFGIPSYGFLHSDISYLLQFGAKLISGVLRRSSIFMEYIPKLIQWGVKGNVINAIDSAYTFGFEDKLDPLGLLTSFLKESEETLSKKIKGFKQTITVRAAKKRYLFDLKSVYGCLKRHRIDPSKLVPGWQFNVKIMSLEQEIAELNELVCQEELAELVKKIRDKKMAQKRKIDETESSGCFSNKEMKNSYFPNPWPPHQQKVVNHVDNSNTTLLEGGGAGGHIYGYSLAPSVLPAPVAGSIHENVVGSLPGPVGGVAAMGGAGASKSVQGGSCAGVHGLNLVDSTPGQIGSHTGQLCGRLGDAIVYDRLASHSYAYRPLSYLEGSGSMGLPNSITVDAYRSPPYLEASTGLPSTLLGDAYKPPSYLEASTGLSNTIPTDAYRPLPYLEAYTVLSNPMPADAYRPPPFLEASTRLPNTITGDAYKPPPYLETYTGFPNTIPADAYRPPPYLKGSMRLPNTTSGDAYRPISTWLPNTKPNNVAGGTLHLIRINSLILFQQLNNTEAVAPKQLMLFHLLRLLILRPTCTGRGSFVLGSLQGSS